MKSCNPTMADVRDQLRQFVIDTFLFGRAEGLPADHASLQQGGILDSTGVMELVQYLERQYSIQVRDEELLPENLDSIAGMAQFVQRKRDA